jgi:aminopeptidase N
MTKLTGALLLGIMTLSLYGSISWSGGVPPNNIDQIPAEKEYVTYNSGDYDVKFYFLNLHASDSSTYLEGSASIALAVVKPALAQVILDFSHYLIADSVKINGTAATYSHANDLLSINISPQADPGTIITVTVFYHGLGSATGDISGIYNKYNSVWNKKVTWTLSEPFSARNWFPCKQVLTDKADSVFVFITTDNHLKAGSNGLLTAQIPLENNRIRYEWKSHHPTAFYLISFAVADYMDYSFYAGNESEADSILIQNYIYNDNAFFEQNKTSIDRTKAFILLFSDLFGDYPFRDEKYGHCVAPMGGGMEHQTMTTLANFSYLLVAHELTHQWFGDYVTCGRWQDIWINEGFASYGEYLAYQYLLSQDDADSWMTREHDLVKSLPDGSVYVPDDQIDDENRIFDYRLSYAKGAAIIHMIRQETDNDSLFFEILREFLNRYKNSCATGRDFLDLVEEKTGRDFDWFYDQWYTGEGFPIHTFNWYHDGDSLFISSLQTTSAGTALFNVRLDLKISINGKDTIISKRQNSSFESWSVYLPGNVSSLQVDPENWLIMKVAGITQADVSENKRLFTLMPNPVSDRVNVIFNRPVEPYTIYLADTSGKILYTSRSAAQHFEIDVERYPRGLYFLIVAEENSIYPIKFVKK